MPCSEELAIQGLKTFIHLTFSITTYILVGRL